VLSPPQGRWAGPLARVGCRPATRGGRQTPDNQGDRIDTLSPDRQ
jgi:hypothetical protein